MTNGTLEVQALVKLLPEQVSQYWELFGGAIQEALPPEVAGTESAMVNILASVLKGDLVCWILNDGTVAKALVTTSIKQDKISKTRNLLIYSFTALDYNIGLDLFNKMMDSLENYAIRHRCKSIIAYSSNKKVVSFMNKQGAITNNVLIEVEV